MALVTMRQLLDEAANGGYASWSDGYNYVYDYYNAENGHWYGTYQALNGEPSGYSPSSPLTSASDYIYYDQTSGTFTGVDAANYFSSYYVADL